MADPPKFGLSRGSWHEKDRRSETKDAAPEELFLLYRQRNGWSQDELARNIGGVTGRTVRNWETRYNQSRLYSGVAVRKNTVGTRKIITRGSDATARRWTVRQGDS